MLTVLPNDLFQKAGLMFLTNKLAWLQIQADLQVMMLSVFILRQWVAVKVTILILHLQYFVILTCFAFLYAPVYFSIQLQYLCTNAYFRVTVLHRNFLFLTSTLFLTNFKFPSSSSSYLMELSLNATPYGNWQ